MDNNDNLSNGEGKDKRFDKQIFIDSLTGLFNQYYLYQFLPEEIKKAKLGNYSLAILVLEINNFKEINDTYGHSCGDEILRQLAEMFKKSVRQTDMVIRYAGGKFAILLPAADFSRGQILSKQFIDNVAKNIFGSKENESINLTINAGIAVFPYDGEQSDNLLEVANKNLHPPKQENGKVQTALAERTFQESIKFIGSIQGAINNFHLYPLGVMRDNSAKESYSILNSIFSEEESLNLAEVEKTLVINGRRLSPKEAQLVNTENFLNLLMKYNVKTVTFIKGIPLNELYKFIDILSQSDKEIKDKGGWIEVLKKEDIRSIRIDEVRFIQVAGVANKISEKNIIEDITLMEFLMGKIDQSRIDRKAIVENMKKEPKKFAQTIMKVVEESIKQGGAESEEKTVTATIQKLNSQVLSSELNPIEYANDLAKVMLELKPDLRNKVIRSQLLDNDPKNQIIRKNLVNFLPNEVIVDMILAEYKETQGNLLVIKEFIDKIIPEGQKRNEIFVKLEAELTKLNVIKQDIAFITGKIKWEELTLDKRIDNIIKLPVKYYKLAMGDIKLLLEGLLAKDNGLALENLLYHLLSKVEQLEILVRRDIMNMMIDFVKTPFSSDTGGAVQIQNRLDNLLERIDSETDPRTFGNLLEIHRELIRDFTFKLQASKNIVLEMDKPETRRYCLFIQQFMYFLLQKLNEDEKRKPNTQKLARDFIRSISDVQFLEILVYLFVNTPSRDKQNFKNIFSIVGGNLIEALINLETQKTIGYGDSFREYVIKKSVIDLFQELGDPALSTLKQKLAYSHDDINPSLIELVGFLKKEEFFDLLLPFLRSKIPTVRRVTISALINTAGHRSAKFISETLRDEKDKNMRIFIKEQLRKLNA